LVQAALDAGVLYVPGEYGHVPDEDGRVPKDECRLCFSVATLEQINEGVKRLRTALRHITGSAASRIGVRQLQRS
jgi:2-aminoadipate transaminase